VNRIPFDLKYRPQNLDTVIGQDGVVKILRIRSIHGTIKDRSMMFGGPKGCGKTTLARIVSKIILCDEIDEDGNPCLACPSCVSIDSASSFDEFDAATQGTVDRIREIVRELEYGTMDGKPRVVILDEAHRLSKQAQDALLKSMEDRRLVVILCTTEPGLIRSAIRDRVYEYPVSLPSQEDLKKLLVKIAKEENLNYDDNSIEMISSMNSSNPRTSLITLDSVSLLGDINIENVKSICRFESKELIVSVLKSLGSGPKSFFQLMDSLVSTEGPGWVRDEMVEAISSCIRTSHGSRPTYQVECDFYDIYGGFWSDIAFRLSSLNRPNFSDIECCLLSSMGNGPIESNILIKPEIPTTDISKAVVEIKKPDPLDLSSELEVKIKEIDVALQVPKTQVEVVPKTPDPITSAKQIVIKNSSVSIDGVVFTADESLTSLDSRIERKSSAPANHSLSIAENVHNKVPSDPSLVPITDKEFARAFTKGFK